MAPEVRVTPSSVTLAPGGVQVFTASMTGVDDPRIVWSASAGTLEADGSNATFTAPGASGDFTVVATSVARPELTGVANVSVRTTDPSSIVALRVSPEALTFEASGVSRELSVTGYDERGFEVALDPSQLEWLVSDPSVVSLVPSGANASIETLVGLGSAVLAVRLASDSNVRSAPVAVTIAELFPDVARLTDADIAFPPPQTLWQPAGEWRDLPDILKRDGEVLIGGFSAEEVAALYGVPDDLVLRYPVVLRGESPTVGQVIYGTEGRMVIGRVVWAETRGDFSLLEVEQVGVQDVFRKLDFEFDGEALEAAGILAPLSTEIVDSALGIQNLEGCKFTGTWDVGDIGSIATLGSTIAWTTRIKWDDAIRPHEFYVGARVETTVSTNLDLRPGARGKAVCPLESTLRVTLPGAGPVAGLIDLTFTFKPEIEIAIAGTVGPRLEVSAEYGVSIEVGGGRLCQPDCENVFVNKVEEIPSDSLQFSSSTNPVNTTIKFTAGVYGTSELGIQVGGGVLVASCQGVSWIPIVNSACNKVLDAMFLSVLSGKAGMELAMDWDSPARVLANEDSSSGAAFNAIIEISLKNEQLNALLELVGHTPASFKLMDVEMTLLPLYRALKVGSITLNGERIEAPNSPLPVAIGNELSIMLEGIRQPDAHWVPGFLRSNLQDGEVWIGRNVRWAEADVAVKGDGLEVLLVVTEALCEHAVDDVVTVNFLGNDNMLGAVPVSTFLGQVRLMCEDDSPVEPPSAADLTVTNLVVTPNALQPGGQATVSFVIANQGETPAGASLTRIRLNNDPSDVTGNDTLLAEFGVLPIAGGGEYSHEQIVTLPAPLPDGNYYLWVIADVRNEVEQSDFSNDRASAPVTLSTPFQACTAGDPSNPAIPCELTTVEQLQAITDNLAGHYVLGGNIDASATATWNLGSGFEPLGSQATPFTGSLNGRGFNIVGLTIDREDQQPTGLFSVVGSQGVISNITIVGGAISGAGPVGAIVGLNSGNLSQVGQSASVGGQDYVGGLIGINSGAISNATNAGAVTGVDLVGGIVGHNVGGGQVSQVHNAGSVRGASQVGGVVGLGSGGAITAATNEAQVTGVYEVGGVLGLGEGALTVTGAHNTGTVTSEGNAGGVAGLHQGTLSASSNSGTVTGTDYVGGIAGIGGDGTVTGVSNSGQVFGRDYVGGVVGQHTTGTISRSFNSGDVNGGDYVGGVTGTSLGNIENSYNIGAVRGTGTAGGITSHLYGEAMIVHSFSAGLVIADIQGSAVVAPWTAPELLIGVHFDLTTTGRPETDVGEGWSTAQMRQQTTYAGWDFAGIWSIQEGVDYPDLITNPR